MSKDSDTGKIDLEEMKAAELEWVQLNQKLSHFQETQNEKLVRKLKENPFVPVGGLATLTCLIVGLVKFARNDMMGSQMMMRGRIAAQGLTVMAGLTGLAMSAKKAQERKSE